MMDHDFDEVMSVWSPTIAAMVRDLRVGECLEVRRTSPTTVEAKKLEIGSDPAED